MIATPWNSARRLYKTFRTLPDEQLILILSRASTSADSIEGHGEDVRAKKVIIAILAARKEREEKLRRELPQFLPLRVSSVIANAFPRLAALLGWLPENDGPPPSL